MRCLLSLGLLGDGLHLLQRHLSSCCLERVPRSHCSRHSRHSRDGVVQAQEIKVCCRWRR